MKDRVIIGETERAGWPISAEIYEDNGGSAVDGTVRWCQKGGYFELQQYRHYYEDHKEIQGWCGVGCVVQPKNEAPI